METQLKLLNNILSSFSQHIIPQIKPTNMDQATTVCPALLWALETEPWTGGSQALGSQHLGSRKPAGLGAAGHPLQNHPPQVHALPWTGRHQRGEKMCVCSPHRKICLQVPWEKKINGYKYFPRNFTENRHHVFRSKAKQNTERAHSPLWKMSQAYIVQTGPLPWLNEFP